MEGESTVNTTLDDKLLEELYYKGWLPASSDKLARAFGTNRKAVEKAIGRLMGRGLTLKIFQQKVGRYVYTTPHDQAAA